MYKIIKLYGIYNQLCCMCWFKRIYLFPFAAVFESLSSGLGTSPLLLFPLCAAKEAASRLPPMISSSAVARLGCIPPGIPSSRLILLLLFAATGPIPEWRHTASSSPSCCLFLLESPVIGIGPSYRWPIPVGSTCFWSRSLMIHRLHGLASIGLGVPDPDPANLFVYWSSTWSLESDKVNEK